MFQKLEDSRMNKLKGLFNLELKKTIRTPIIMFFSILAPQFFIYIQSSLSEEVIMNGQSIPSIDYSFPMFLYLAVIVVGIGNVGEWLSLFSFNEVIEYFDEIESIEVKMESLKEEIINDLEDLIGETSRFTWKLSLTPMNLTNAFKR